MGVYPTLSVPACYYASLPSFFICGNKTIGDPGSRLVFYFLLRLTQPERDMGGLHRLMHHSYQFLPQRIQIHLIAQCRAESSQRTCRVIFVTVKSSVDGGLNAPSQWLELNSPCFCGKFWVGDSYKGC